MPAATDMIDKSDVMGRALLEHLDSGRNQCISTWTSVAGDDVLNTDYLLRAFDQMPFIEQVALESSRGKVLDVGCGSGSHSLWLQKNGLEVTSIDISAGCIACCRKRGLKNALVQDIWELKKGAFDTILLLMNGAGMCANLDRLAMLLKHLKALLAPGGQILTDSSDIIYMFESESGEIEIPEDHYYGEVMFRTQYKDNSNSFPWLYVDYSNLNHLAQEAGFDCELIAEGSHYDYLARLS